MATRLASSDVSFELPRIGVVGRQCPLLAVLSENFIRSGLVAFAAVIGRLSCGLRELITLQNLNVIRPLERGWVRQVLLTHATADFRDRGKLPRSKKPDKSIE